MNVKKIVVQALVGAILFTVVSVILDGNHTEEVWLEKGLRGLMFGVIYGIFLVVKEKFIKKEE